MNAIQERLLEFANTLGGPREVSRKLKKSENYLGGYIYGNFLPGNKLQEALRKLGCDIEWLMTGEENRRSAWRGLNLEVTGTKDPPKGTTADVMLSPAHCGDATEIFEGVSAQIDVTRYHNEHTFYVTARGESMTGAGIDEGDMLLVDVEREPKSGNIVLVRIADKVSVKRLRKNGEDVLLTPENPEFEPIPVTKNTRILAVVIRVDKYLI